MLAQFDAFTSLPTADLQAAKSFYEGTLGLAPGEHLGPSDDENMGLLYSSGSSKFLVYPSAFAGTNQATAMGFNVPAAEFDGVVSALRAKGISFDTFDIPDGTWNDGVLEGMGMKSVWFKDPDANILNVSTATE